MLFRSESLPPNAVLATNDQLIAFENFMVIVGTEWIYLAVFLVGEFFFPFLCWTHKMI